MKNLKVIKLYLPTLFLCIACFCTPVLALDSMINDDATLLPGYINNYVLVADTNTAVTVPTGAVYAVFSSNADIWVKVGGVAAIPSANITDGSGSELNPIARRIEGESTIGVISGYTAKVSIAFYRR